MPKQLLVGYDSPAETLFAVLAMLLLVVAAAGLWRLLAAGPAGAARSDALRLTGLVGAALVLPALAAIAGEDHLITRNLLAVAPLGAALAAAGLVQAERLLPALGRAAIVSALAIGVVVVVGVALDPRSQRDDWRGAVRALGSTPGERLVVATPPTAIAPLRYYLPSAHRMAGESTPATEIDYIALSPRSPGERPNPPHPPQPPTPAPGFVVFASVYAQTYTTLRLRAASPWPVPRTGAIGLDGKGRDAARLHALAAAQM